MGAFKTKRRGMAVLLGLMVVVASPIGAVASADPVLSPVVNTVSPPQGPSAGGTSVTITGSGFTGATEVSFGGAHALFTVDADTSITATSPPGSPGKVDVRVTTPAGRSAFAESDQFKFLWPKTVVVCVVPALAGKTLRGARIALRKAHCRLGRVSPRGSRTGTVTHQSRIPGKVLRAESRVNVELG